LLSQDYKIASKELKELMGGLEKSSKEVKKLESEVTAKVTRLSELEGAAASDSEAVSNRRDNLEKLRKDAGELEMQRHRLEGEKEQLELQLTSAREQVNRSGQWLESIITDVKEADFQLEDLQVGRESTAKNWKKQGNC
jgi:chromosome segregation ATPase